MKGRDFPSLSLQMIVTDFYDKSSEPDILGAVAIRPEDAEAFCEDLERLAVEKYGGATFEELWELDVNDESADAALERYIANHPDHGEGQSAQENPQKSQQADTVASKLVAERERQRLEAYRKGIQKASEADRRDIERRQKLEAGLRRKEMAKRRKELGFKVIKGGAGEGADKSVDPE